MGPLGFVLKKDASKMVSILSKYKKVWVDVMMLEELGIIENKNSPFRNGLATFISFVVKGSLIEIGKRGSAAK